MQQGFTLLTKNADIQAAGMQIDTAIMTMSAIRKFIETSSLWVLSPFKSSQKAGLVEKA